SGRRRRTRRRVPPGHRLALADWRVRGSLGAGPRRDGRRAARRARALPRAAARAPRRRRPGTSPRDRRRRRALHGARLPVPGVVRRRGVAPDTTPRLTASSRHRILTIQCQLGTPKMRAVSPTGRTWLRRFYRGERWLLALCLAIAVAILEGCPPPPVIAP